MIHVLAAWHLHQHFDARRNQGRLKSSFWSDDVGPVLVRTLRAKAQSHTRREGVTQYCPEIADDDDMGHLGGLAQPRLGKDLKNRHSSIELEAWRGINARSTFKLKTACQIITIIQHGSKAFPSAGSVSNVYQSLVSEFC